MGKEIEHLPALAEPNFPAYLQPIQPPNIEPEEGAIPLSHYFWIIRRQSWKIALFVATCLVATFVISARLQPIYESVATISIDRNAPSGIVGDEAQKPGGGSQDADQYIATQMKMVQSDAVLRPVAEKFDLLEREHQLRGLSPQMTRALRDAPTQLRQLRVSRPTNTYLVQVSYRSPSPQLAADVANAIARSYLEHIYRIQIASSTSASGFMEKQIDELRAKMERSGQALAQFEKELNVVSPEEKTNIVSARLLQLNTEYTAAQADRVRKEAMYNSMKTGSLAAVQISGQGEDLAKLQDRINDMQQKFAEIRASRGPNHPDFKRAQSQLNELMAQYAASREQIGRRIEIDYRQALNREQMLQAAVMQTKEEFDKINSRSFDYQRLKQEADADKKLYEELVTKIQEGTINAGFQNRNTAISDEARPQSGPVFPNLRLNLALAGVLSLMLGVAAVILMDSLDTTVRDPDQIGRLFGADLIGTLPFVRDSKALASAQPQAALIALPAETASYDEKSLSSFEEAIRMLRNSILLSDFDRRIRTLLFTSSTPGEGKSTTAMHLAIAHAQQGKKTLLIDADLRRPTLHKKLGVDPPVGLSSVFTSDCPWEATIVEIAQVPNLHLLPSGPSSRRAADLIGTGIIDVLDQVGSVYDLVIIDAPPLLGFAEPMQLAIAVDGVVIVAVAGETSRRAIQSVVGTLRRLRANLLGIVLNRTTRSSSNGYYYYDYHYNYYRPQSSKD